MFEAFRPWRGTSLAVTVASFAERAIPVGRLHFLGARCILNLAAGALLHHDVTYFLRECAPIPVEVIFEQRPFWEVGILSFVFP